MAQLTDSSNDILKSIRKAEREEEGSLLDGDGTESTRKALENRSLAQDINERKRFANRAFGLTITWIVFLILLTLAQFICCRWQIGLTEVEFNIVFSTTTGSVLIFWWLVGKYLFNSKR